MQGTGFTEEERRWLLQEGFHRCLKQLDFLYVLEDPVYGNFYIGVSNALRTATRFEGIHKRLRRSIFAEKPQEVYEKLKTLVIGDRDG